MIRIQLVYSKHTNKKHVWCPNMPVSDPSMFLSRSPQLCVVWSKCLSTSSQEPRPEIAHTLAILNKYKLAKLNMKQIAIMKHTCNMISQLKENALAILVRGDHRADQGPSGPKHVAWHVGFMYHVSCDIHTHTPAR